MNSCFAITRAESGRLKINWQNTHRLL